MQEFQVEGGDIRREDFINQVEEFVTFHHWEGIETCWQARAHLRGVVLDYVRRTLLVLRDWVEPFTSEEVSVARPKSCLQGPVPAQTSTTVHLLLLLLLLQLLLPLLRRWWWQLLQQSLCSQVCQNAREFSFIGIMPLTHYIKARV